MFKKIISTIIIICILSGFMCFSVNADDEVLELVFSDDFESYEVGTTPTKNTGDFTKWTSVVKSDASPVFVTEITSAFLNISSKVTI